jgi:membrane protein
MKKTKKKHRKNFFRRFWDAFWRPEMLILPGQIAFFLFLSVIPTITLIGYVCAYANISNDLFQELLSNVFSGEIASLIAPVITSTEITPAFFITLGVGYFIASNGMSSIIVASNTIYGIKDSGFFKRRLKAIIMQLVIVLLLLFVLIIPLLSESIINILKYFSLDSQTSTIVTKTLNILNGPVSWVVIFIFIKIIYTMAPDKEIPGRNANGGAIFTTIGWVVVTMLYAYYINNYSMYSIFYGSLANIVVLMLWVYFLSYIFVIGMAMNYREEIEKTGAVEISDIIASSANSAPVMTEEPKDSKKKSIKDMIDSKFAEEDEKEKLAIIKEETMKLEKLAEQLEKSQAEKEKAKKKKKDKKKKEDE